MKKNIDPKKIKSDGFKKGKQLTFSVTFKKQTAQDDLIDYVILFGDELNN